MIMKNGIIAITSVAALLLAIAAPAKAGNADPSVLETLPANEPAEKGWEFAFQPYGWASDISGHADIAGSRFDIDFPISDIIESMDMAVMFTAVARRDRFSFVADYLYLKLSGDRPLGGPAFRYQKTALRMNLLNLAATYRVWDNDCAYVELGVGSRYLGNEVEFHLNSGLAPAQYNRSEVQSWNGLGVIRAGYEINEKWRLRGHFDIGGGDADITWLANVALLYQLKQSTSLVLGYRYLYFEAGSGNNGIELDVSGPYLGLEISF